MFSEVLLAVTLVLCLITLFTVRSRASPLVQPLPPLPPWPHTRSSSPSPPPGPLMSVDDELVGLFESMAVSPGQEVNFNRTGTIFAVPERSPPSPVSSFFDEPDTNQESEQEEFDEEYEQYLRAYNITAYKVNTVKKGSDLRPMVLIRTFIERHYV